MSAVGKVIIDTDPGYDDAAFLTCMVGHKDVEVLALTTVFGNDTLDKTTKNACRLLEFLGKSDIPVHKGAYFAMDKADEEPTDEYNHFVHGPDGMNNPPSIPLTPTKKPQPGTFGPLEICKLAQQYPGEITLIAIGPLTNIAIAVKILPQLPLLLKSFFIMGGSTEIGNVTRWAEHNFYRDVLAASLVMGKFTAETLVHVVTWETCLNNTFPYVDYFNLFKDPTENSKQKVILEETGWSCWDKERYNDDPSVGHLLADQLVSLALLYPSSVTKTTTYSFKSVNLNKDDPKYGLMSVLPSHGDTQRGIKLYEAFNMKYAVTMFMDAIRKTFIA